MSGFMLLLLMVVDGKLDKLVSDFELRRSAAEARLIDEIDRAGTLVRRRRDLPAAARQDLIDGLEQAADEFRASGTLPFAPLLLEATAEYVATIQQARLPVLRGYESAIDSALRASKDDLAKVLREESEARIGPRAITSLECEGIDFRARFSWTLYDDGSARISNHPSRCSWTVERGKLIIRNIGPGTPKEGWIDRFEIAPDGTSATATNQLGDRYGARFVPLPDETQE